MKKIALSIVLLSTCLLADGFFVGISGGVGLKSISEDGMKKTGNGTQVWIEDDMDENDKNYSAFMYGIKGGYQYTLRDLHSLKAYWDYSRGNFSGSNYTNKMSVDLITANLDYHYDINPRVSIFGGLSLGSVLVDTKGDYGSSNAFGYGINLGIDYDLNDNLELEAKYRYFDAELDEKKCPTSSSNSTCTESAIDNSLTSAKKVSPDDLMIFSIGLNYKF